MLRKIHLQTWRIRLPVTTLAIQTRLHRMNLAMTLILLPQTIPAIPQMRKIHLPRTILQKTTPKTPLAVMAMNPTKMIRSAVANQSAKGHRTLLAATVLA